MNTIIRSIASELKHQGRTRYWLAKQIGIHPRHIYRLLSGERTLSSDVAADMLRALGLRVK